MKGYNKEKCLEYMFNLQENLQNLLGEKRGILLPREWDVLDNTVVPMEKSVEIHTKMSRESGYYMMSTVTELFEFYEAIHSQNTNAGYRNLDDARFELIDAWHFLIAQMLYLNIRPTKTLDEYMKQAFVGNEEFTLSGLVGSLTISLGELYQNTSYKHWKTYTEPKEDKKVLTEIADKIFMQFCRLYVLLDMTAEDVWKFYYMKNEENIKRQAKNGIYEK